MIIWTLIGYILQVIGNILKRSDILFLGYYLSGTGKTRALPVYVHKLILEDLSWFRQYCYPDTYIIYKSYNDIIYHTIGKCWVKKDINYIYIKDVYMFYPICSECDKHFHDCTCEQKQFAVLNKHLFYIPHKLYDRISDDTVIKINKYMKFEFHFYALTLSINDKFWVNKGKPFDVYTEIVYNKI